MTSFLVHSAIGTPAWTGRWLSPKGDRWWQVWACEKHTDELTGLRQFGG
jgi:hypothetical protein